MTWTLVLIGLAVVALGGYALIGSKRASVAHPTHDPSGLVGVIGEAMETFASTGMVRVRGELWRATSRRGIVQRGEQVRVTHAGPGLVVEVEKVNET